MRIYVGNLSYDVTAEELRLLFEPYGQVLSANIITDKFTGNSKGFGFVEMQSPEAGQKAVKELRGKQIKGRTLNVEEAHPLSSAGGPGARTGSRAGGGRGRPPRGNY